MTTKNLPVTLLAGLLACGGFYALSCGAAPEATPRAETQQPVRMHNAKQTFLRVKDSLLKGYYDDHITEDDLYRAALKGMLENLDPKMQAYNHLLDPDEMNQLRLELSGEFMGVGVQIKFDEASGIADVLGAIPGSAAEKAGVKEGDKILSVNGKGYKGRTLRDMVYDIRGKAGEVVTLAILRGTAIQQIQVRRERVVYDNVTGRTLPGRIAYLGITSFNAKTEAAARAALGTLKGQGPAALVLDLRDNGGGSFEAAVGTCGLLLPKGQPVVQVVRRGGKREVFSTKADPVLGGVPVAVLINRHTASGAEFCAAALRERLGAQLIGEKTTGKWSVQTIEELPDNFAMKYTVSLFRTPSDKGYEGEGVTPDVPVSMDEKQGQEAQRAKDGESQLRLDVQLRTAARLLTR